MGTRGPRADFVEDRDGNPVVGLRIHRKKLADGSRVDRYYTELPNGKRHYFGSDRDKTDAIFQFRAWEAERQRAYVDLMFKVAPRRRSPDEWDPLQPRLIFDLDKLKPPPSMDPVAFVMAEPPPIPHVAWIQVPDDALWMKFADLLRATPPTLAAQKLGVPEVAYLSDLKPPEPPARCADLLPLYLRKRKAVSAAEERKVRDAWLFFVETTNAHTLADIDQNQVDAWERKLFAAYEAGDIGAKTVRHKVQRVTRILRYAVRKQVDSPNASRLLALIGKIDLPSGHEPDPRPISVSDFRALYHASDPQWRCILLLGLNCAFYPKDVITLPMEAIDLEEGVVRFRRAKTRVARVAMLWPETQQAVQEYLTHCVHDSGLLIRSVRGSGFTYDGFRDAFNRLKASAKLPDVTFDQIRDGAYTAACQTGIDERDAKILAGHRCGLSDSYVMRNPQRTQAAVDTIRRYYKIARLNGTRSAKHDRRKAQTR